MPPKNSVKTYVGEGYYHLYNRGVEKRDIFLDEQDYAVFTSYLKTYLTPKNVDELHAIFSSKESNYKAKDKALKMLSLKNFSDEINLLAYCLMPNHFHLLIRQENYNGIDRLMRALATRYAVYFNSKYKRVGSLFQGVYKAVIIENERQLLHLSRYIHLNPFIKKGLPVNQWSEIITPFSLPEYLGQRKTEWVKPETVLSYFNKEKFANSYFEFLGGSTDRELIHSLMMDEQED